MNSSLSSSTADSDAVDGAAVSIWVVFVEFGNPMRRENCDTSVLEILPTIVEFGNPMQCEKCDTSVLEMLPDIVGELPLAELRILVASLLERIESTL